MATILDIFPAILVVAIVDIVRAMVATMAVTVRITGSITARDITALPARDIMAHDITARDIIPDTASAIEALATVIVTTIPTANRMRIC